MAVVTKLHTPSEVSIVVWEGEWPLLKSVVRTGRVATLTAGAFIRDVTDISDIKDVTRVVASTADRQVHNFSLILARAMHTYAPDFVPLCGVVIPTAFAFFKSTRWGPFAASRNAVLVMGLSACVIFPDRVWNAAARRVPFFRSDNVDSKASGN